MQFQIIQADRNGESCFSAREIAVHEVPFGPPPNPMGGRVDLGAVESMFLFEVPAGTSVPSHNAPSPYIAIVVSGECEIQASNGEVRRFGPGGVLFCEDLTGKGHVTLALTDTVVAFVQRRATD